jgi:hypothetical protein
MRLCRAVTPFTQVRNVRCQVRSLPLRAPSKIGIADRRALYQGLRIVSTPPMYGRNTSGTVTLASGC